MCLVVTFHAVWSIHKLTNGEGHDSRVARELLGRGKQIIERVREVRVREVSVLREVKR